MQPWPQCVVGPQLADLESTSNKYLNLLTENGTVKQCLKCKFGAPGTTCGLRVPDAQSGKGNGGERGRRLSLVDGPTKFEQKNR